MGKSKKSDIGVGIAIVLAAIVLGKKTAAPGTPGGPSIQVTWESPPGSKPVLEAGMRAMLRAGELRFNAGSTARAKIRITNPNAIPITASGIFGISANAKSALDSVEVSPNNYRDWTVDVTVPLATGYYVPSGVVAWDGGTIPFETSTVIVVGTLIAPTVGAWW